MKGNGESVNWSQDWKFVSGVSYASMVCANLTGIGKSKPKKSNNAPIKGRKERSPMLIVEQDLNNIKRSLETKRLVYKSKASENCNVRAKSLCSQNVGQCVPTFNRFKVLGDNDTIQGSNKSDMGFHSDVHSKVTQFQKPVNSGVSSSDKSDCQLGLKSLKITDSDRKRVSATRNTGKHVKQWVLSENADKYDLELRFKPHHRQKFENARNNVTFDKWNKQMSGKYGFIPLGDLVKPNADCRNPMITDIKLLHNTVKNAKNHNFLGAQVQN